MGETYLDMFPADILRMTLKCLDLPDQTRLYLSHNSSFLAIRLETIWKQYWDYRISYGISIPSYTCHALMFISAEFGHLGLLKKLIDTRIGLNPGEFYFRPLTPFHTAVKYQHRDVVSYILDLTVGSRVNINLRDRNGLTALHHAVENGDLKMTKLLLSRKADPYAMSPCQSQRGRFTPIGLAILESQPSTEALRLFHSRNIDLTRNCVDLVIMRTNCSLPPLHYATINGNVHIVKVLLECGLDPDGRAYGYAHGSAPLHSLVQYGLNRPWKQVSPMIPRYIEIIQILIQHGADLTMWTMECKRPIDLLTKDKRMDPRIYELLTPKL